MDITLRDYLKQADELHEFVKKFGLMCQHSTLEEKIHNLQVGIRNIQAVAKRMADVSNIANRALCYRHKNKQAIETYPTENDHAVLRTLYPVESKQVNQIVLPICTVERAIDIPISKLYYINELKQYAININGVLLKGNLANIVEYQTKKSARCEYGVECKALKKQKDCNYFHDPEDYIKLSQPIPEDNYRNFTVGSWLYSKNKRPKTYFTRHVGSANSLMLDLSNLKRIQYREEISNREGQLIHDLLIYMILHNKGFVERYTHWK